MQDPIEKALYDREKAQEAWLESQPICYYCGNHIQDEEKHQFPDGRWVCEDCWKDAGGIYE